MPVGSPALSSSYTRSLGEKLMGATKGELRKVATKLDEVKLELLRLRAVLLPEERVTIRERMLIELGRRGKYGKVITLR